MARKRKSLFTKMIILSILILACFGGYKLYDANHDDIEYFGRKVEKVINKF